MLSLRVYFSHVCVGQEQQASIAHDWVTLYAALQNCILHTLPQDLYQRAAFPLTNIPSVSA